MEESGYAVGDHVHIRGPLFDLVNIPARIVDFTERHHYRTGTRLHLQVAIDGPVPGSNGLPGWPAGTKIFVTPEELW